MNAHATKKNGFAIQQDLGASGLNAAETDLILHTIGFRFDRDFIKLGIGG